MASNTPRELYQQTTIDYTDQLLDALKEQVGIGRGVAIPSSELGKWGDFERVLRDEVDRHRVALDFMEEGERSTFLQETAKSMVEQDNDLFVERRAGQSELKLDTKKVTHDKREMPAFAKHIKEGFEGPYQAWRKAGDGQAKEAFAALEDPQAKTAVMDVGNLTMSYIHSAREAADNSLMKPETKGEVMGVNSEWFSLIRDNVSEKIQGLGSNSPAFLSDRLQKVDGILLSGYGHEGDQLSKEILSEMRPEQVTLEKSQASRNMVFVLDNDAQAQKVLPKLEALIEQGIDPSLDEAGKQKQRDSAIKREEQDGKTVLTIRSERLWGPANEWKKKGGQEEVRETGQAVEQEAAVSPNEAQPETQRMSRQERLKLARAEVQSTEAIDALRGSINAEDRTTQRKASRAERMQQSQELMGSQEMKEITSLWKKATVQAGIPEPSEKEKANLPPVPDKPLNAPPPKGKAPAPPSPKGDSSKEASKDTPVGPPPSTPAPPPPAGGGGKGRH